MFSTFDVLAKNNKEEVFVSGNWRGNALYKKDGRFGSCTMRAPYVSGTELYFAMNDKLTWTLGINNSKWAMDVGAKRTATIQIDQKPPVTGSMKVISDNGFYILFDKKSKLLKDLRSGKEMVVYVDDFKAKYELKGTGKAITALIGCAMVRRGIINPAMIQAAKSSEEADVVDEEIPTSSTEKEKRSQESEQDDRRTLLVQTIEKYLNTTGVTSFKIFDVSEHPEEGYDIMWETPNSPTAGIKIIQNRNDIDIDQMAGLIIAKDASRCEGEFASAKKFPSEPKAKSQRNISTVCHEGPLSKETHYALYHRENGSFVKFAQSSQYSNQTDRDSLSPTLRTIPDQSVIDSLPN